MAYGDCKRWNGSAWVSAPVTVYDGASQVATVGSFWNGSAWEQIWPAVVVNLDGESINSTGSGTRTAGLRVNSDGTVDKRIQTTYSQIDNATDWIIPNSASADDTYHVRMTVDAGDAFTSGPSSWVNVNTNPVWYLQDSAPLTNTCTLEISNDGGSTTLTSGTYVFNVESL